MTGKKFLAILIVAAVVISGAFAVAFPGQVDKSFTIVHTNDTHCHYDDEDCVGFPTVAVLRKELSGEMPVFTVDAGDLMQGNAYGTITEGLGSVYVANSVGYDLGVPGNRDFDYGLDTLLQNAEELNYPLVCANVVYKDTQKPIFQEYKILKKGNVKVGFFGLLTRETVQSVQEENLEKVRITDEVEAAQHMVDLLKTKGVDCIVAVGHLGVQRTGYYTSDYVCNQVEGIDIFIDGHSHTEMEDGKVCDGSIELLPSDTVIASTGCYTKNVGIVKSLPDGISAKLYRGPALQDTLVSDVIDVVESAVDDMLKTVVGTTEVALNGKKEDIRSGETNLGDLFVDQLARMTSSDIAIVNSGQIRASIPVGDITLHMIYDMLPYSNSTATLEVPGSAIWDAMELSLSKIGKGQFLQISGMTVTYNPEGESGHKVVSIMVGDKPIDLNAKYTMATIDFLQGGGDGYEMLAGYEHHIKESIKDLLADYIYHNSPITESTIKGNRLIAQ